MTPVDVPTKVVLAARSQDKLKEVQKSIEDLGGEALVVPADCSKVQCFCMKNS